MKKQKALKKPTAVRSNIMKANRGANTRLELLVRKILWSQGFRGYRVNYKKLPGKPDIAFTKAKLAIFIHGCFWHSCPNCNRSEPKTNKQFWQEKFERNKIRDADAQKRLNDLGWSVVVLWECKIKSNISSCVRKIAPFLEMYSLKNNDGSETIK